MTVSYDEVIEKPLHWGIPGLLPIGQLTLLAGKAGVGKGTVLADWIARVTRGAVLPGGVTLPAGRVLIAGPEDDPETSMKPRLVAAGADTSRVKDITYTDDGSLFSIGGDDDDLPWLRDKIKSYGDVRMVVLDPLSALAGCSLNVVRTVRRQIIEPLQRLAKELNIMIVLVHHFNKTGTLAGSQAIVDAARLVLEIKRFDEIREVNILKTNLTQDNVRTVCYYIEGISPRSRVRYVSGR